MNTDLHRMFACDIIQNAGILLKLPQVALTTAQILLQRVYHYPSITLDKYPLDITAMATLFLAAKVEETPRKACEVIDVFIYVISQKLQKPLKLSYRKHEIVREELIKAERRLLKNLGFNLLSNYPHKILINYYHGIVHYLDPEHNIWKERKNRNLLQTAWNYCNDSLRTEAFIKYTQEAIACACIEMACEDEQMLFPMSTDGRKWYKIFIKNDEEVEEAIQTIRNLYRKEVINPHELKRFMYINRYYDEYGQIGR